MAFFEGPRVPVEKILAGPPDPHAVGLPGADLPPAQCRQHLPPPAQMGRPPVGIQKLLLKVFVVRGRWGRRRVGRAGAQLRDGEVARAVLDAHVEARVDVSVEQVEERVDVETGVFEVCGRFQRRVDAPTAKEKRGLRLDPNRVEDGPQLWSPRRLRSRLGVHPWRPKSCSAAASGPDMMLELSCIRSTT